MVVTGEFENAEKSREAINLAARYFKKRGLLLHQVTDMPGVTNEDVEKAKELAALSQNQGA